MHCMHGVKGQIQTLSLHSFNLTFLSPITTISLLWVSYYYRT